MWQSPKVTGRFASHFPSIRGIPTPLRPQARFERNRRKAAALSARCGALARNDSKFGKQQFIIQIKQ